MRKRRSKQGAIDSALGPTTEIFTQQPHSLNGAYLLTTLYGFCPKPSSPLLLSAGTPRPHRTGEIATPFTARSRCQCFAALAMLWPALAWTSTESLFTACDEGRATKVRNLSINLNKKGT